MSEAQPRTPSVGNSHKQDPPEDIVHCVGKLRATFQDSGKLGIAGIARKLGRLCPKNASRDWWRLLGGGPETCLSISHDVCLEKNCP